MDRSTFAGILTSAALAAGILFNLGWFWAVDLNLFPLLSYKDHLETLVLFVPTVGVILLIWKYNLDQPGRRALIEKLGLFIAAVTACCWISADGMVGIPALLPVIGGIEFFGALLTVSYCSARILTLLLAEDLSVEARTQAMVMPSLGFFLFVAFPPEAGAPAEVQPAKLLRALDAGLLVVFESEPQKVSFVRYESIRRLSENLSR
jgi:hypothetical protein